LLSQLYIASLSLPLEEKYIYLLWDYEKMPDINNTRVKIGISNNPYERTRAIITGSGIEYAMPLFFLKLKSIDNTESVIHKLFANFRITGEWFVMNPFNAIDEIIKIEDRFTDMIISDQIQDFVSAFWLEKLGIKLENL